VGHGGRWQLGATQRPPLEAAAGAPSLSPPARCASCGRTARCGPHWFRVEGSTTTLRLYTESVTAKRLQGQVGPEMTIRLVQAATDVLRCILQTANMADRDHHDKPPPTGPRLLPLALTTTHNYCLWHVRQTAVGQQVHIEPSTARNRSQMSPYMSCQQGSFKLGGLRAQAAVVERHALKAPY
jgi:hypothetical protein